MYKDSMIACLHVLYRKAKFINDFYESLGESFDTLGAYISQVWNNNYFDTASDEMLDKYEKECAIAANKNSKKQRASLIRSKWIMTGKATLEQLQNIADSWDNGLIEISFKNGKIHFEFTSPVGIPAGIDSLKSMLSKAIPAHLPYEWEWKYIFWSDVKAGTYTKSNKWNNYKTELTDWSNVRYDQSKQKG